MGSGLGSLTTIVAPVCLCLRQNPNAHPRPVSQDLAGFWDMLQLSIENISLKFDELHQLKANHWKPLAPPEIQVQTRVPSYRMAFLSIISICLEACMIFPVFFLLTHAYLCWLLSRCCLPDVTCICALFCFVFVLSC